MRAALGFSRPRVPVLLLPLLLTTAASAQGIRDVTCDGTVNQADRDALVDQLFSPEPPTCPASDVNRDGSRTAADLVALVLGPRLTHLGIASPDGRPALPLGALEDGAVVYFRNAGFGFLFVVETAPPPSGAEIGTSVFDSAPGDPRRRPDFQVIVDHRLGDGSRMVCDEFGVPAIDPPDFAFSQAISDTINDLACRFEVATARNGACTQDTFGQPSFVDQDSRAQFCLRVTGSMAFASGETRVTVQVRDRSGLVGPSRQMVLRVGTGLIPPTFTPLPPTPTRTATETASATATATLMPTASATATQTATGTATRTFTASATRTATPAPTVTPTARATSTPPATATRTRTRSVTATATRTVSGAPTATRTRTASFSPTPVPGTATRTATRTATGATPTRTPTRPTPTRTRTATSAGTPTRTASPTRTRTRSATMGPSPTVTRTRTISPTPTATVEANGPVVTFFGVTRADDMLVQPTGNASGVPIYEPPFGSGFSLVVEAKPGASRAPVGTSTFDLFGAPDLRIQVDHALGNGSAAVCDDTPPLLGGVPAINPPNFADDPSVNDRLNDLACRFIDGVGNKFARRCGSETACVLAADGEFGCAAGDSMQQFCGFISQVLAFPLGDTLVTVRVADARGQLGPPARLIIRVR